MWRWILGGNSRVEQDKSGYVTYISVYDQENACFLLYNIRETHNSEGKHVHQSDSCANFQRRQNQDWSIFRKQSHSLWSTHCSQRETVQHRCFREKKWPRRPVFICMWGPKQSQSGQMASSLVGALQGMLGKRRVKCRLHTAWWGSTRSHFLPQNWVELH